MNTRIVSVSGLVAALLIPAQLLAATPSHQCAQLWDDVLRLSCYDTAFGKPRPPAEAAASQAPAIPVAPPAPAVSAAPVAAAATASVVAPSAAAAPAASGAAPVAAATQTQPAANAAGNKKGGDNKKGADVVASVTAVSQALDGRLRVTLDNGQVWQQTEVESINQFRPGDQTPHQLFQVKAGDQVTVKSGVLGSRTMVAVDGRTARVMLVK